MQFLCKPRKLRRRRSINNALDGHQLTFRALAAWTCQTNLPDSLFVEDGGDPCGSGLPAWALVVYISSVESREPITQAQTQLFALCVIKKGWLMCPIKSYLQPDWRSCPLQSFEPVTTSLKQSQPEEAALSPPTKNTEQGDKTSEGKTHTDKAMFTVK